MPLKGCQIRRWGLFNAVGVLGFALQLAVLFGLKRGFSMNYLAATALAVEAAVLHNFVWHEHLTWADVIAPLCHGVWSRLARFHLANGLISILGNLGLTWVLVERLRCPYLVANAVSVAVCSLVNFFASDQFVFLVILDPTVRTADRKGAENTPIKSHLSARASGSKPLGIFAFQFDSASGT